MNGLSRPQFWACLAMLVGIFAFWGGPIWDDPLDIDAGVYASYLLVPVVVTPFLLYSRRFSWRALAMATFELAVLKFAVTASIATGLWAVTDPAPTEQTWRPPAQHTAATVTPPVPTALGETMAVTGEVVDEASGEPLAGAVVYVASGLEGFAFAAPERPVALRVTSAGFEPPVVAVQTWQPLVLESGDGTLHTVVARDGERQLFNVAVPAGASRQVQLREGGGVADLWCGAHDTAHQDPAAAAIVLHHPYAAITGAGGAFSLEGVPQTEVTLEARHPTRAARVMRSAK